MADAVTALREVLQLVAGTSGDEADAMVSALDAAGFTLTPIAPPQGWQPIETAPKERVSILVTGGTFTWIDGSLSDCDWPLEFVAQAAWRNGHWSLGHNKHGDECIAEPKWWQPMPEPPTTEPGSEP